MTREEAIRLLKQYQGYESMFPDGEELKHAFDLTDETLDTLLSAIGPTSRGQVEKAWRGEWKFEPDIYDFGTYVCSKSGEPGTLIDGTPMENNMNFCPNCGAPMTDDAVDITMKRLEAMKDGE